MLYAYVKRRDITWARTAGVIDARRVAVHHVLMERVLHVRGGVGRVVEALKVRLVVRHDPLHRALQLGAGNVLRKRVGNGTV